jgi:periplasmic protein TonB
MNAQQVLQSDILDIIFDGKNKAYGAYDLRKSYPRRIAYAMGSMLMLTALMYAGFLLANGKEQIHNPQVIAEYILEDIPPVEPPAPELPPPPPPPPVPQMNTRIYTAPVLVAEVPENERPPEMEELEHAAIGTQHIQSDFYSDVVAPPVETTGKGIIEAPVRTEEDAVFHKVEIESEFEGGPAAWARFLNRNLRYPQDAADNLIQGQVIVQFIVDQEGNISNVEAISGPDELKQEAIRVIKKSGKWTAAIQNGRKVKSYKKQPIVFRLAIE